MMVLLCTGHGSVGNAAGVQDQCWAGFMQATFSAETAFSTVQTGKGVAAGGQRLRSGLEISVGAGAVLSRADGRGSWMILPCSRATHSKVQKPLKSVELRRFELLTSSMRTKRSTN